MSSISEISTAAHTRNSTQPSSPELVYQVIRRNGTVTPFDSTKISSP